MALEKRFLHKEPDFIKLSRFKLIAGIALGLSFSFSLYSFLYVIREAFRITSVTKAYDLWVLTDSEVHFYNLIFACISVIIGQSIAFTFWFDRPNRFSEKRSRRKSAIVNDQRALNWYFLSWFSKLAIAFGIMFGIALQRGFYAFSFYPDYNYLFVLFVIVLYLQTWNTIRLTLKRKSLKWMLASIVVLSVVAFGLSKVNLIDYKALNQSYLAKNIHFNYKLEVPETDNFTPSWNIGYSKDIYLVKPKSELESTESIIVIDNEEIAIENLHETILDWQSTMDPAEIPFLNVCLHIHKTTQMTLVNQVTRELIRSGILKVDYAVTPANPEYDKKFYQYDYFPMRLPHWNTDSFHLKKVHDHLDKTPNVIEITLSGSEVFINGYQVEKGEIQHLVKKLIPQNLDYAIKFHSNDRVDFSDYFNILSSAKGAVYELRDEYAELNYSKKYEFLDYEKKVNIKRKFPFHLFELTHELEKRTGNE